MDAQHRAHVFGLVAAAEKFESFLLRKFPSHAQYAGHLQCRFLATSIRLVIKVYPALACSW